MAVDALQWKSAVVEMVRILAQMAEADTEHLWEYHLPEVAATEERLVEVEQCLGEPLDSRYRAFLRTAGGWSCFFQRVDLFGPADLSATSARMRRARELLSYLEESVLADLDARADQLLPIACSTVSIDLFVITRRGSRRPGTVIWLEGREIDRYATFDEFFMAMMAYNREEVSDLQSGR
jgi:hypothetical protein